MVRTWISAQLFFFMFGWAVYVGYWAVLLIPRGFDGRAVGLAVTVGLVTRAVSLALAFPAVNARVPLGVIIRVVPWLSVGCAALFIPRDSYALVIVASAALGFVFPVLLAALETLATLAAAKGRIEYGPTRMVGSIGYIVGTFCCGAVQGIWGSEALLWLFVAACVVLGFAGVLPVEVDAGGAQKAAGVREWGRIFSRRDIVVVIVVMVLLQASHAAYYTYGSVRFMQLGASPMLVSTLLNVAQGTEILFLLAAPRYQDRWSVRTLLAISLVAAAVRWGVLGVAGTTLVAGLAQPLHGITFAVAQVAFTRFLARDVPPDLAGPIQGLMNAAAMGLGLAGMTAVAGVLWDRSVFAAFAVMVVVALAGLPFLSRAFVPVLGERPRP